MTHQELRQKVEDLYFQFNMPVKALLEIIQLHEPNVQGLCDMCNWISNGGFVVYPCPTIKAIEAHFGN